VAGNQSNGNTGTKACDDAGKTRMETVPGDDEKKVTRESGKEGSDPSKEDERDDQEKDASINSTNNVNAASTNEVNVVDTKTSIELPLVQICQNWKIIAYLKMMKMLVQRLT
ncbi:hypothetical protein Tco_0283570, partial [Tanacetum coccineum]